MVKKALCCALAIALAVALAAPAAAKGEDDGVRWLDIELPEEVAEQVRAGQAERAWAHSLGYVEPLGLLSVSGSYRGDLVFDIKTGRQTEYTKAYQLNERLVAFALDSDGEGYGIMDTDGRVIVDPVCRAPGNLGGGMFGAVSESEGVAYLLNAEGEIVETFAFDEEFWFGSSGDGADGKEWLCPVTRDWDHCVINADGEPVIPFGTYSDIYSIKGGLIAAVDENYRYGVVDAGGNVLIPFDYMGIDIGEDGLIAACNEDGLCGVLDEKGNVLIPFEHGYIHLSGHGLAAAGRGTRANGNFGVLDAEGNVVAPFEYEEVDFIFRGGELYIVAYDAGDSGIRGLFDRKGREILPVEYDYISPRDNGFIVTVRDGQCGVVDRSGEYVLGPLPGDHMYLEENIAVVLSDFNRDEISGVFSLAGDELVSADDHDELNVMMEGGVGARVAVLDGNERKTGLLGGQGEVLLPLRYDVISPLDIDGDYVTGTFLVMDGRRVGIYEAPLFPTAGDDGTEEETPPDPAPADDGGEDKGHSDHTSGEDKGQSGPASRDDGGDGGSKGAPAWVWALVGAGAAGVTAAAAAVVTVSVKKKRQVRASRGAPEGAAKFCGGCGARLAPGERFCPQCGKKV